MPLARIWILALLPCLFGWKDERSHHPKPRGDTEIGGDTGINLFSDCTPAWDKNHLHIPLYLGISAQEDSAKGPRAEDLKKHVETLASAEYEGRLAGAPGADKAAAYIIQQFTSCGLKPALEGYRQSFSFPILDHPVQTLKPMIGKTSNIVGFLEGSDEKLKDEVVVIGAHYDHLGKKGQPDPGRRHERKANGDEVWHGADDNASGVAALLALAGSGWKPKRSVLFIAFGAKEHGNRGSEWYVAHPIVPLEKTALMINLDRIGRSSVQVHGVSSGRGIRGPAERAVAAEGVKAELFEYGDLREEEGDHAPFFERQIPSLLFTTGTNEDTREPTDTADKLDYATLEKISRCVLGLVSDLTDRPAFVPPPSLGITQGGVLAEEEAKKLGLEADRGGLLVVEVMKDSAAEKAGLKPGDWIVEIAGTSLPLKDPLRGFRRALERVKPGDPISLTVYREGKRLVLPSK